MRILLSVLFLLIASVGNSAEIYERSDALTTGTTLVSTSASTSINLAESLSIPTRDFYNNPRTVLRISIADAEKTVVADAVTSDTASTTTTTLQASARLSFLLSGDPSIMHQGQAPETTGLVLKEGDTVHVIANHPYLHIRALNAEGGYVPVSVTRVR